MRGGYARRALTEPSMLAVGAEAHVGRRASAGIEDVGRLGRFTADMLRNLPDAWTRGPLATLHARRLGVDSLPI